MLVGIHRLRVVQTVISVHVNATKKESVQRAERHWKSFPISPAKNILTLIVRHNGNAERGIRSLFIIPALIDRKGCSHPYKP